MPEHYPSIGEAIGAAMQHNIRLAHGPDPAQPLQLRYFPPPAADPYSMPGMIARLEVTANPQDVAGIVEEATSALVGPLPQLTELVAASADWARARLDFDAPHSNPAFEVWTRLASAHRMLAQVQEDLEAALDGIASLPAEVSASRNHDFVKVLRTRELLHDVMGAGHPEPDPEAKRRQAAIAGSPSAHAPSGARPATPAATPSPHVGGPTPGRTR
ncbi:hypothetical protein [Kitasatospora purpeofusca]|uniref:hypothetical protein n=1 Tax=Kitasatospora purpeofusca TaxID=67352 RepID=UPI002250B52E|nr:hypothetical protein [Kitasatospora purpeofusca]MCX4752450.1 hypothetical protein [Kitasatospora purpeofusca]WSR32023.1 hypothetical protein OG715_14135 [Kitasatospora purpeofusca]